MKNCAYCLGFLLAALSLLVSSCASQLDESVLNAFDSEAPGNCTTLVVRSTSIRNFGANTGDTLDDDDYHFLEGDSLRFHASGACEVEDGWFVYENDKWINTDAYLWSEATDSAHIVMVYPGLQRYDTTTLYDEEGRLKDVVYWEAQVPAFKAMNPEFTHRFSRLVIKMDDDMAPLVKSVGIEIGPVVSALDPYTAALTLDDSQVMTSESDVNGQKVTFIVPSECRPHILVSFFFYDGSYYSKTLDCEGDFVANHSYHVLYHFNYG